MTALAVLTFDVDAESVVLAEDARHADNPMLMSHQAYGPEVGDVSRLGAGSTRDGRGFRLQLLAEPRPRDEAADERGCRDTVLPVFRLLLEAEDRGVVPGPLQQGRGAGDARVRHDLALVELA